MGGMAIEFFGQGQWCEFDGAQLYCWFFF